MLAETFVLLLVSGSKKHASDQKVKSVYVSVLTFQCRVCNSPFPQTQSSKISCDHIKLSPVSPNHSDSLILLYTSDASKSSQTDTKIQNYYQKWTDNMNSQFPGMFFVIWNSSLRCCFSTFGVLHFCSGRHISQKDSPHRYLTGIDCTGGVATFLPFLLKWAYNGIWFGKKWDIG